MYYDIVHAARRTDWPYFVSYMRSLFLSSSSDNLNCQPQEGLDGDWMGMGIGWGITFYRYTLLLFVRPRQTVRSCSSVCTTNHSRVYGKLIHSYPSLFILTTSQPSIVAHGSIDTDTYRCIHRWGGGGGVISPPPFSPCSLPSTPRVDPDRDMYKRWHVNEFTTIWIKYEARSRAGSRAALTHLEMAV